MEYALSTEGQGSTSYIQSSITFGGASTVAFEFGGRFEVQSLAANTDLFRSQSSSLHVLRVETTGRLVLLQSGERIASAAGSIVAGVPFEWKVINNLSTGNWELYLNDMANPVGTFARTTLSFQLNQLPRSTSANTYGFKVYNLWQTVGSFVDRWDETTTTGTGTVWTSVGGTRTLTCTNFAGAADSWWIYYTPASPVLSPVSSARPLSATLLANVSATSFTSIAFRQGIERKDSLGASFRQPLEKLETLETSLRANVSRSILASASFRADVSGLYILETAFGASLSPVQRAAALQVVLRSQVSSSKTTEATLRNNVSRTSQANAVFRANVAKASALSTALRASLEAQTALQAQLLGIASAYKVLSVNLEGTTDWTAPAFRVSMSLETPRASLSFGNKAGISFSTPRAKI